MEPVVKRVPKGVLVTETLPLRAVAMHQTGDKFARLLLSTIEFYKRFGLEPNTQDTEAVVREELREFMTAAGALEWELRPYDSIANSVEISELREAAAEEAIDLIVTVLGHALASGVSWQHLLLAAVNVSNKNDAKTHQTHEVIETAPGVRKIQRIGRKSPYVKPQYDPESPRYGGTEANNA